MKLLLGAIVLGTAGSILAQEEPAKVRIAVRPTIATEIVAGGVTKNAPFTADESGESVRLLPDGNRIVKNWTGTMARNSEGKIRRDITSGEIGDSSSRPLLFGGNVVMPTVVAISAADSAHKAVLSKIDAEHAVAHRTIVTTPAEGSGLTVIASTGDEGEARRILLTRIEEAAAAGTAKAGAAEVAARAAVESEVVRAILPAKTADDGKFATRKESLGTRDFSGVQAEGTRLITTIPVGAVGNEREIEITSETWFAREIGVIVYSKRAAPRVGESTYQLTNIQRVEPDASLFTRK